MRTRYPLTYERLTERELEILRLKWDGLTHRAIGERLFLGKRTVEWHMEQVYGRLGVSSGIAACRVALRLGLLQIMGK